MLTVKSEQIAKLARSLFGDTVNLTTEGNRYLGAVIGSEEYTKQHCHELVNNLVNSNLVHVFSQNNSDFDKFTQPIEDALEMRLIPNLMGTDGSINEPFRSLVGLYPGEGGLGIHRIKDSASDQNKASRIITQSHDDTIVSQEMIKIETEMDGNYITYIRNEVARLKTTRKQPQ